MILRDPKRQRELDAAIERVVKEYGAVLRALARDDEEEKEDSIQQEAEEDN